MSNQIKDNEESLLKEDECYTCTECSTQIEILDIDEENNKLSFKCFNHGKKDITIKEYFEKMIKNTFLYKKCSSCNKQQKEINNKVNFKYCFWCKLLLCDECSVKHDKNHLFIDNNKLNITCKIHPFNINKMYCIDCNAHLCEDCLKQRNHIMHQKIYLTEIEPTPDEVNNVIKLIDEYKNKVNKFVIEKIKFYPKKNN